MLKYLGFVALLISFQVSAQSEQEQIQDARKKQKTEELVKEQLKANEKEKSKIIINPYTNYKDLSPIKEGRKADSECKGCKVYEPEAHAQCLKECSFYKDKKSKDYASCVELCVDNKSDQPSKDDAQALEDKINSMRKLDLRNTGCEMSDDEQSISCPQGEYVKRPSTIDNIRKVVEKPQNVQKKSSGSKSSKAAKK